MATHVPAWNRISLLRHAPGWAVAMALALALSACAGQQDRAATPAGPPRGTPPEELAKPLFPPEQETAIREEPPPPPKVDADPDRLMGLDGTALTELLGKPVFVRQDSPAELWRYRHDSCLLDLFLYADIKEKIAHYRVEHVSARGMNGVDIGTEDCLRALLIERAAAKSAG